MKLTDVTPANKKKSKNSKDNYRPVSILSNISKNYERRIFDQIPLFFYTLLSKYQCGFRRGYNAQHCLITLIEKWKKSVDNDGAFGALLTDLSKAFDCLSLELLIAKVDAYGFDKSSLKLIHMHLPNSKQKSSAILFEWLNNNYMAVNTGNSHLLLPGNSRATAKIDNSYIELEDKQVLKVKCPYKNRSLHEYTETKNNHEVFCSFSIWLFSINLDVLQ